MTDIPLGMTRGPAYWLGLAAAPVFACMALVSGVSGGEAVLCGVAHGGSAVSGMPVMYALMAVFHLAPWLKLTSR